MPRRCIQTETYLSYLYNKELLVSEYFDFTAKPKLFWLTVNRKCNFRCKWCYAESSEYQPRDNMTLETAREIVDLACNMDVHRITLIGGEPTYWNSLVEFNQYCKDKDVHVGMVTNASRFGNDKYWTWYLKSPCDDVGVSVKGVSATQFSDLVGSPKLLEQTIRGIKRALDFYQNDGVSTVYSRLVSIDDLKEIATTSKELGAKSFMVSLCTAMLSEDGASGEYMVEPHKLASELMDVYPFLNQIYGGKITFELSLPLCLWPKTFIDQLIDKGQIASVCHVQDRGGLVFDTVGDIMPCNGMMGVYIARKGVDFNDAESLMNHLDCQELRDDYAELLRYPADCCERCSYNDRCRGGCVINWTVLEPQNLCRSV